MIRPYMDLSAPREVVRVWRVCFDAPLEALYAEEADTHVIDRVTFYDGIKSTHRPSSRAGVTRYALYGVEGLAVRPCDMAPIVGVIRKNKVAARYRLAGDTEWHDITEDMNWET